MKINSPGINPSVASESLAPSIPRLFRLTNKTGTELILSNVGAAVVSLLVADKFGNKADIVLGYDELHQYLEDEYYMGSVVGRYANRISGNAVQINDELFQLQSKDPGYHHHGGIAGFNRKLFEVTSLEGRNGFAFSYISPDMEQGYPGEFRLEVIYTLTDEDEWVVEYRGVSDKPTIVNLTQHVYFNLAGDPVGTIDNHELQIFADHYLPVNTLQVPTGELAPVINTPFDFSGLKTISVDLHQDHEQLLLGQGYDHSFVLEQKHSGELKHAATVREPESGRVLQVFTTEPSVHFYSGNFLDNIPGKNGRVYNERSGFCLETQHFPDSPNQPHFPSTLLKAGELFYSKTVFKFSVDL